MAESKFNYRKSESPILGRPVKRKLNYSQTANKEIFELEQIHDRLVQHLKQKDKISRKNLKQYVEKTKTLKPESIKGRWLLMKIRDLLNYVMRKRGDLHGSALTGESTSMGMSFSQPDNSFREIPEPPLFHSQPNTNSSEFSSKFLTNNNFLTMDSEVNKSLELSQPLDLPRQRSNSSYFSSDFRPNKNLVKDAAPVVNVENYSQDLFSDELSSLHRASDDNYNLLKTLTQNSSDENQDQIKDHIDTVLQAHEKVKHNYCSLLSLPTMTPLSTNGEIKTSNPEIHNVFDDPTINDNELCAEFSKLFIQTESWYHGIVETLLNSDFNKAPCAAESQEAARGSSLSCYSEENLKIIREVQNEFRKKLQDFMGDEDKAEVLRSLFGFNNSQC